MLVANRNCKPFLVCYASQKGTARSIAENLLDQLVSHSIGEKVDLYCISKIDNINLLKKYYLVIFVGSTTGEGDPPETAIGFMRKLRDLIKENTVLTWLYYTILGLGDTNYTNFCNFGQTLDKYLQRLQANRFYNCGWADDGTGLEEVVEPWIEGIFPALRSFLSLKSNFTDNENLGNKVYQNISSSSTSFHCGKMNDDITTETNENIVSSNDELKSYNVNEQSKELMSLYSALGLPSPQELRNHTVRECKFSITDSLNLPSVPLTYIETKFINKCYLSSQSCLKQCFESISFPLQNSKIISCSILDSKKLTTDNAVKTALELTLVFEDQNEIFYEPGDSFCIITPNRKHEVNLVLSLLNLLDKADYELVLSVDPSTKKKVASIPSYIPSNISTRFLLTYCLDIRAIPKKPFLRALVNFTSDPMDKRRLEELVSKEGSDEYNKIVRTNHLTFIDLIILFPSCKPSLAVLIEHLPRLQPRPYSITSSPLDSSKTISFVFNIIDIPTEGSVTFHRTGLCTGWLGSKVLQTSLETCTNEVNDLVARVTNLQLAESQKDLDLLIYFRSNQQFRLPKSLDTPLIMIGPGTGVAPFVGFLKHRQAQIKCSILENDSLNKANDENPLFTWLFFGCRHKDRDFLYKNELEAFQVNNILTKLSLSFSRDGEDIKYIQDNLMKYGEEIVQCIDKENASIYVCGDAKHMSKNVMDVFAHIIQSFLVLSEIDAKRYIAKLQISGRYLQDVWG